MKRTFTYSISLLVCWILLGSIAIGQTYQVETTFGPDHAYYQDRTNFFPYEVDCSTDFIEVVFELSEQGKMAVYEDLECTRPISHENLSEILFGLLGNPYGITDEACQQLWREYAVLTSEKEQQAFLLAHLVAGNWWGTQAGKPRFRGLGNSSLGSTEIWEIKKGKIATELTGICWIYYDGSYKHQLFLDPSDPFFPYDQLTLNRMPGGIAEDNVQAAIKNGWAFRLPYKMTLVDQEGLGTEAPYSEVLNYIEQDLPYRSLEQYPKRKLKAQTKANYHVLLDWRNECNALGITERKDHVLMPPAFFQTVLGPAAKLVAEGKVTAYDPRKGHSYSQLDFQEVMFSINGVSQGESDWEDDWGDDFGGDEFGSDFQLPVAEPISPFPAPDTSLLKYYSWDDEFEVIHWEHPTLTESQRLDYFIKWTLLESAVVQGKLVKRGKKVEFVPELITLLWRDPGCTLPDMNVCSLKIADLDAQGLTFQGQSVSEYLAELSYPHLAIRVNDYRFQSLYECLEVQPILEGGNWKEL